MEVIVGASATPEQQSLAAPPPKTERLNSAVQQQLNLESVKTRALGLTKAISRILEEFNAIAHTIATPKWQDILGQFSMVNMELYNIVEDIRKVSKAFVVYPKNVNGGTSLILPVMLSSKLLPEMELEDTAKKEILLSGMANVPIPTQIEKVKVRIDMIGAACELAEKIIADTRKAYGLGSRHGPTLVPTLDKVQAAKIQEQENQLRAAVNFGEGLRITGDQRHFPSSLPPHLADVLAPSDGVHNFGESGTFSKSTPAFSSNTVNPQGLLMQTQVGQVIGRSVPSPSAISGATSFDNASTPPLSYANSPRSGGNIMNTPSPQQQSQLQQHTQLQQQHAHQQQQRQKIMQLPQHHQQLLAQQQHRQTSSAAILGQQGNMSHLHDAQGQSQQKFQHVPGQHQMQYSQALSQQQFQNRQLQTAHIQHNMTQNQMSQGGQLRNHLSQYNGSANSVLFNAAQTSPNSQMFGLAGGHPQRNFQSQIMTDQIFSMGASNPSNMVGMQPQQHGLQGGFGNIPGNSQSLQPNTAGLSNTTHNPIFQQQRQQNQQ